MCWCQGGKTSALKLVGYLQDHALCLVTADLIIKNISEHKKSTVLSEVGLQVWRGAFLLNDFILSNRDLFSNKKVLELGSGVGLTSILASIFAKKVICTGLEIKGQS